MGSKGHLPPPHTRRLLMSPGMLHPDPFGPGIHPPPGGYPFDMLPPPEVMDQKLAQQHLEMERLLTENRRLASTHSVLRRELAAAQQELNRLQEHMGAMKAEQEQHMRGLLDRMSKMEADLQTAEPVKLELQQAHAEAQRLLAARQEMISKVQQLTQDLQRSHGDVQQIPALISELEGLRQEYQQCRTTYDYERKLHIDHYESLQIMEKNYISMVKEVEKLQAELTNLDRSGASYGSNAGYKESDASVQRSAGQSSYEDVYGAQQGRGQLGGGGGAVPYGGAPAGATPSRPGYNAASRGPTYDAPKNSTYETSRVPAGYDSSRGGSYDPPKGATAGVYEVPRGGPGYAASASRAGVGGAQTATAAGNVAVPYGSAQTPVPYGSAQGLNSYGSAQTSNLYGSGTAQASNPYGSAQAPNPYGSAQAHAPNPYGSAQAQAQAPTVGSGGYDAPPRGSGKTGGGNVARR